jgi:beta-glucanase (GH16 family)
MPKGKGVWTAFWLNPEDAVWPPEIDIFEYVNNGQDDTPNMIHTNVIDKGGPQDPVWGNADPNFNKQWFYWKAPYDFPDDHHVVGALWDAKGVTTYVDGKAIATVGYKWLHDNGQDAGLAHILLNYAIGGQWAGRYGVDPDLGTAFEIDWVRAYQPAGAAKGTSKVGRDLL